jgi:hypothetical protein
MDPRQGDTLYHKTKGLVRVLGISQFTGARDVAGEFQVLAFASTEEYFPPADQIDWSAVEKYCMETPMDCYPQSAREWEHFISQYEELMRILKGKTFELHTRDPLIIAAFSSAEERQAFEAFVMKTGYKKSLLEFCSDLAERAEERSVFEAFGFHRAVWGLKWSKTKIEFTIDLEDFNL